MGCGGRRNLLVGSFVALLVVENDEIKVPFDAAVLVISDADRPPPLLNALKSTQVNVLLKRVRRGIDLADRRNDYLAFSGLAKASVPALIPVGSTDARYVTTTP